MPLTICTLDSIGSVCTTAFSRVIRMRYSLPCLAQVAEMSANSQKMIPLFRIPFVPSAGKNSVQLVPVIENSNFGFTDTLAAVDSRNSISSNWSASPMVIVSPLSTKNTMSLPAFRNSVNLSVVFTRATSISANWPDNWKMGFTCAAASMPIIVAEPSVVSTSKAVTSPPVAADSSMLTRITSSSLPPAIAPVT